MQHQFLQSVIFTLQRGNFASVVFSMLHMDIAGLAIILLSCDYQLHCKNNVNNLFTCRTLYCTLLCIIMYFVSIICILVCLKGFSGHLWPCIFYSLDIKIWIWFSVMQIEMHIVCLFACIYYSQMCSKYRQQTNITLNHSSFNVKTIKKMQGHKWLEKPFRHTRISIILTRGKVLSWEYRYPRKRNSRPSSTPTILNAHSPNTLFTTKNLSQPFCR